MIRLTLLLCAGLYLGLMVLGQDHGQKRSGLLLAKSQPVVQQPEATQTTLFIPAQPVVKPVEPVIATEAPMAPTPVVQSVSELPVAQGAQVTEAAPPPPPEISGGILYTVRANQANVRGGPGRNFAVLDSLQRGEQVLVVPEDQPLEGWSRIRIEGDGIEGYVSTRLLTRSE